MGRRPNWKTPYDVQYRHCISDDALQMALNMLLATLVYHDPIAEKCTYRYGVCIE
jgi:hypothetical protein